MVRSWPFSFLGSMLILSIAKKLEYDGLVKGIELEDGTLFYEVNSEFSGTWVGCGSIYETAKLIFEYIMNDASHTSAVTLADFLVSLSHNHEVIALFEREGFHSAQLKEVLWVTSSLKEKFPEVFEI